MSAKSREKRRTRACLPAAVATNKGKEGGRREREREEERRGRCDHRVESVPEA